MTPKTFPASVASCAQRSNSKIVPVLVASPRLIAGTRDLYPIHHDRDFAKASGARDIFVNTMSYEAFFGRLATDWAEPEAFLRQLRFSTNGPNCLGDTIASRGWVVSKRDEGGAKLLDLEIHLDNEVERDATVAHLTIELPERVRAWADLLRSFAIFAPGARTHGRTDSNQAGEACGLPGCPFEGRL